ncbi:HepT-like ribonuclease domain-containing protein [Sinomonas sp. ASV322]|uniref:HepT-like ribonuclease domain-containing protein n=1 Tax=Sinomonas sp. ASV322 TaxID=3041920 RepID=UPI0027DB04B0|nr:HepT-like ribonuclease domain-containing protein [Sinomonas sp. ASV322]MDQ4502826.1 DUF86 domain-containing protein [Sinomonas sp. ASV322]
MLEDMEQRLAWAAEIVADGEDAFIAEPNWRTREALKSLLIDLNTAADRLPESVREKYPEIPWRELRDQRNLLAHDYASIRHSILWATASRHLPPLRDQLAGVRRDLGH